MGLAFAALRIKDANSFVTFSPQSSIPELDVNMVPAYGISKTFFGFEISFPFYG
jgi:hypothetical protein